MAGRTRSSARSARNAGPRDKGESTVAATRATSDATATGMQIQHESGKQDIPSGKEAGSQVPIVGGDPTPDAEGPQKPRGQQAKPALFSSNGSIAADMVASPSGLVPISATVATQEEAEKKLTERVDEHKRHVQRTNRQRRLDDATVGRLTHPELRAIGEARGYELPQGGNRTTRAAFLRAQDADKGLAKED
jgi:hypothetical protein